MIDKEFQRLKEDIQRWINKLSESLPKPSEIFKGKVKND